MPLIKQDYWVSNFFGNTMYLLALSYYFVITFLGYNGMFSIDTILTKRASANSNPSTALPQPNRDPPRTDTGTGRPMVHQPLHLRLRNEFGASLVVRRQLAKAGMILQGACVLYNSLEYAKVFVHIYHIRLETVRADHLNLMQCGLRTM